MKHLAYEYARRGAYLTLVARREDRLRLVANRCRRLGSPDVAVVRGDVSVIEDCKRFIEETISRFGRRELFLGLDNKYFFLFKIKQNKSCHHCGDGCSGSPGEQCGNCGGQVFRRLFTNL